MTDITYLFTSFEGRISRRTFWIASSIMLTAEFALTVALGQTAGLGWRDFAFGDRQALWINLVVISFFFWPSLALCVKRLHDRDFPGWWAALLHVLFFIFYVGQAVSRPLTRDPTKIFISLVPAVLLFLVGAWLLIELAFVAGTRGPNQFGPAPDQPDTAGQPVRAGEGLPLPHPGE